MFLGQTSYHKTRKALYLFQVNTTVTLVNPFFIVQGYLVIHVLGLLTGTILLPPSPSDFRRLQNRTRRGGEDISVPSKSRSRQDAKTAIELCSYAAVWWALFGLGSLAGVGGGVSRRLVCSQLTSVGFGADGSFYTFQANAPYVLWVAAYNASFLTAYLALDIIFFSHAPSRSHSRTSSNALSPKSAGRVELQPGTQPPRKTAMLLEAINLNGLPLFLLVRIIFCEVKPLSPSMFRSA
jgi:glucosaminylphosphatidylinositol acyltransferase